MAGASKSSFFYGKKSIREISIMLLKSEKSIYRYLKKLPEYKQEKEKRKKQTVKREKNIKNNGTGKTGQKDTIVLTGKV